jgi:mevalonate kinase
VSCRAAVAASCPGRVCFAGEDIDWTIGPAVLAAVELRLTATLGPPRRGQGDLVVMESSHPFTQRIAIPTGALGVYDGGTFDYARAAIARLLRTAGVTLEPVVLRIDSEVPPSAGLSSSAAVVVATLAAANAYYGLGLPPSELCAIAYDVESDELATGAGQMDFYACALGGVLYLDCSASPPSPLERYALPEPLAIVVVDTGVRRSTSEVIAGKRLRWSRAEPAMRRYVTDTSRLVEDIRSKLRERPLDMKCLGELVLACHRSLRDDLGVSTALIDECVELSMRNGAYGAKLTGTGMGGCLFALCPSDSAEQIVRALGSLDVRAMTTSVDVGGLAVATLER